jgi:hypothetical protein
MNNMELGDRIEVLEEKFSEIATQNRAILVQLEELLDRGKAPEASGNVRDQGRPPPVNSPIPPNTTPRMTPIRSPLKPLPLNEFSGDRTKGRAFINSCELYIRLVPEQFADEITMVHWALTYMKSGQAALFAQRVLRSEECNNGMLRYIHWKSFRATFVADFCPENEVQLALAKLETSAYHQGQRSVDEYVDDFKELINQAGYMEGLAIVVKFRCGLQREIQDQIAQLVIGRPGDDNPEAWYDAAIWSDENRITNSLFYGGTRQLPTCSLIMAPNPLNSGLPRHAAAPRIAPFWQEKATLALPPRPAAQQNPVSMDINTARRKAATPVVCYCCGEAGHIRTNCPQWFNIRFLTHEEKEEYMQEWVLRSDVEEAQLRAEEAHENPEAEESDFRRNSK